LKQLVFFLLLFFAVTFIFAETNVRMSIQQVKEEYQAELMALPGVVSIGIGLSEGETVIKIGLDGKHPDTEKSLPKRLGGYRVVSLDVGSIKTK